MKVATVAEKRPVFDVCVSAREYHDTKYGVRLTNTRIPSVSPFQLSITSLSCFSASVRYMDHTVSEESPYFSPGKHESENEL
jgi:uncharacterized protein (UPF0210 family)